MSEERGTGVIEQCYLLVKMKGDETAYGVKILEENKEAAAQFITGIAATFCQDGVLQIHPVDFLKFNKPDEPTKTDEPAKPIKWVCAENLATAKKWAESQKLAHMTGWLYVGSVKDLPSDSDRKQLIAVVHGRGKLEEGTRLFNLVEEARELGFKIVKVRA